jgi:hypothetical protein
MDVKSAHEFCSRWLRAWTGNEPERLLEFYDQQAFYLDPAHSRGLKGKEQIRPYFCKLLARYPDWEWRAKEIFPSDKGFLLKWQAELGDGIRFSGVDIVEIQAGKIIRNEVYFDPSVLRPSV